MALFDWSASSNIACTSLSFKWVKISAAKSSELDSAIKEIKVIDLMFGSI